MPLPYSDTLPIGRLARIFDSTSECYKFFWFKAVFNFTIEGQTVMRYEDLVDEMIADAWYMVTEYHLNLGPADTLEKVVSMISQRSALRSNQKKTSIIDWLKNSEDKEIIRCKNTLIINVPYRLQSPFFTAIRSSTGDWKLPKDGLIVRLNSYTDALYSYGPYKGLDTVITVRPEWALYLIANQQVISGWVEYCMIQYLQKRNPGIPGIIDKIYPPCERDLKLVKVYYKELLQIRAMHDIYSSITIDSNTDISIDHFIPWSFVAHDELWNLCPTLKCINSSKNNSLPDWVSYFPRLREQEYENCQLIWSYDSVRRAFESCARKNLNDDHIKAVLYRPDIARDDFYRRLEEIIKPSYLSAKNSGFASWKYDKESLKHGE